MNMRSSIKNWVLANLPDSVIVRMKAYHYLRLLRKGRWDEEKDFAVIAKLVKPGDHVVDIGANYGVYMAFLSGLVGAAGVVYSVEPIPTTFTIISANARKLKLRNVRLLNCAFSDRDESVVMEVPRLSSGGENYYMARIIRGLPDPTLRRFTIRTVTLDSQFSARDTELSFIKCDVEGHELQCVSGALQVIRKWRPAWCVEVSGDPDLESSRSWALFRMLESESYRPYWFNGAALVERQPGDVSVNYFFLQSWHLERVSELLTT